MEQIDYLLAMVQRADEGHPSGDWADALTQFSSCLDRLKDKLSANDMDALLSVGALFYWNFARYEARGGANLARDRQDKC